MTTDKIKRIEQFSQLEKDIFSGKYTDLAYQKAELITDLSVHKNHRLACVSDLHFVAENSVKAALSIKEPTILVFCSAKNPGGGVARGSKAQEEDIALSSTWYFQVKDVTGFYLEKHASAINTDSLLYIKHGYILKDSYGQDSLPYALSFIGATAPNLNGLLNQGKKINEIEVYQVLEKRIENVLKFAESRGRKHLVLGAWGCGVFGLNPEKVANLFNQKIRQGWYSGEITFAIPDKSILAIFRHQCEIKPVVTRNSKKHSL